MQRINKLTTTRARSLRSHMTQAEQKLWYALRNKQLQRHRFRRQHAIGSYIADFACIEARCIIELDGGQHQAQATYDQRRTEFLEAQGWKVLRFWNNDVLVNIEGVLSIINTFLLSQETPSSFQGEGRGGG